MEMTVTEIGAVVVAELRAAGYLESTIGQYAKTIKALSLDSRETARGLSPASAGRVSAARWRFRACPRAGLNKLA
jgi:hypothetical protein